MNRSAKWKEVYCFSLLVMLFTPQIVHAARAPGRDLPSSNDGGCKTVNPCGGTTPLLASFPAVTLTGSGGKFTVTITPYILGQVASGTTAPYSILSNSGGSANTVINVGLTSNPSNSSVRLVAVAIGANLPNSGYVTAPTMSMPAGFPYTGSPTPPPSGFPSTPSLSLSDPVTNADAGYTVWALGSNAPANVALLVSNSIPNTTAVPTVLNPTDTGFTYSFSPTQPTNGLTQPSSSASYAVVVYNGTGYEIVGGLSLMGEPGPCGGTQVNPSVNCHSYTSPVNISLAGNVFSDLTRVDNAPSSSTSSTNTGDSADDAAVCTNSLANSSSMYHRLTYTYTPVSNQKVTASTAGSHYATVLTVTGGTTSACSTLARDGTDYQAELGSLALTAGTQYTINVGEYPPLDVQTSSCSTAPCPFSADPVLQFTLTATPDSTSTAVSCTPTSVTAGQPLSCTATVTDATNSTNTASGNVQFAFTLSGSSTPAATLTSALTGTTATVNTSGLLAGTYQVVATFQSSVGVYLTSNTSTSVAVVLTPTTTTESVSSATPLVGATFNITGTVTKGSSSTLPTGTVVLFDGSTQVGTAISLASGGFSIPVTNAATGSHSYTVQYSGDSLYATSTSSSIQVVVGKDASTTVLVASGTSLNLNGSVTLTATVSNGSGTSLTPGGTVTFLNGVAVLGTVSVNNGIATLTPAALTSAAGTYGIAAQYSGDTNFTASTSNALSLTVVAPDFSLKAEQPSLTIAEGQTGTSKIDLTAVGGFVQTVTFSCSGLPVNATCTFSSPTLTPDAAGDLASSTVTIKTGTSTTALNVMQTSGGVVSCFLAGAILFVVRKRKHSFPSRDVGIFRVLLIGLMLAGASVSLCSCGGGGNSSSGNSGSSPVTPAGTYTLVINAAAGSGAPKSVSVQVTVTQ